MKIKLTKSTLLNLLKWIWVHFCISLIVVICFIGVLLKSILVGLFEGIREEINELFDGDDYAYVDNETQYNNYNSNENRYDYNRDEYKNEYSKHTDYGSKDGYWSHESYSSGNKDRYDD